eukprot:5391343-Pleurochrysis_carterae.AAC.1
MKSSGGYEHEKQASNKAKVEAKKETASDSAENPQSVKRTDGEILGYEQVLMSDKLTATLTGPGWQHG